VTKRAVLTAESTTAFSGSPDRVEDTVALVAFDAVDLVGRFQPDTEVECPAR